MFRRPEPTVRGRPGQACHERKAFRVGLNKKEKLEKYFLDLIHNRRPGRRADALRTVLRQLSRIYAGIIAAWNFLYERASSAIIPWDARSSASAT